MRILFLTHRVPYPPDKGDRIRSYNIIKFLARNHDLSLMSVSHEPVPPQSYKALGEYCDSVEIVRHQLQDQHDKERASFIHQEAVDSAGLL